MAREFLGNIKGPQGEQGPKGDAGDLSDVVIGTENLIDLTELTNYDGSGSQAVDLETGTILYHNTAYFIQNIKTLSAGTYFYYVEDYTEHADYYAGRLRTNVRNAETSQDMLSGSIEKGQIYSFEVTETAEYLIEFRMSGVARRDGFIKKPMLVKGDGIGEWSLSRRDREVYSDLVTPNHFYLGDSMTGNTSGSLSVDSKNGRINFENVAWTILSSSLSVGMPLESKMYYLRLPQFTSNRSMSSAIVTIRDSSGEIDGQRYVVEQGSTTAIDLRDVGAGNYSIGIMLANGTGLDGFIEKPLLTDSPIIGKWRQSQRDVDETPSPQPNRSMYCRLHRDGFEGTEQLDMGYYGVSGIDLRSGADMVLSEGLYSFTWTAHFTGIETSYLILRLLHNENVTLRNSLYTDGSMVLTTTLVANEGDTLRVTAQKMDDADTITQIGFTGANRMVVTKLN